jgi:teichuronic acid biosynthesis glycosyltransferase TuaC
VTGGNGNGNGSGSALHILVVANWDLARSPTPWATQRIAALRAAGADVEVLSVECVQDRKGFLQLWRALGARLDRDPRPDVVAPLYGSILGLICALQRKVPCAVSFAGSDLNGTRGSDGWLTPGSLPSIAASQIAAAIASGVSVRTSAMRGSILWDPARRRTRVIGSGVDMCRFSPMPRDEARRRRGLPSDGARVAFVAIDAEKRPWKRLDLARAAVALLPGVTLDVVDRLPLDEMRAAYAASDALVLTSWQEGSPNCVKEALACGVPVVSVDVGDVRDVVEGMTNCAVVGPQPTEIARALSAAITDGRGCPVGPARMAARYSMEAMAGEFLAMYRQVGGLS